MKTESMAVKDLVLSDRLLDLRRVDRVTVSRYRQNLREGAVFPPVKWCRKHGIVVGGNHRVTAMREEFGDDHATAVEVLECGDWAAVLEEFARDNSTHGLPLGGYARRRVALELIEAGRSAAEVARLFNVSARAVEQWGGHVVLVFGTGRKKETPTALPVKVGVPKGAAPIQRAGYEVHRKREYGIPAIGLARQLTAWCRRGWVTFAGEGDREVFCELRDELTRVLTAVDDEATTKG
ncbi:MAG: helix-turn-helix domain-containing protein [Anaerovoracaceae bacterium]